MRTAAVKKCTTVFLYARRNEPWVHKNTNTEVQQTLLHIGFGAVFDYSCTSQQTLLICTAILADPKWVSASTISHCFWPSKWMDGGRRQVGGIALWSGKCFCMAWGRWYLWKVPWTQLVAYRSSPIRYTRTCRLCSLGRMVSISKKPVTRTVRECFEERYEKTSDFLLHLSTLTWT